MTRRRKFSDTTNKLNSRSNQDVRAVRAQKSAVSAKGVNAPRCGTVLVDPNAVVHLKPASIEVTMETDIATWWVLCRRGDL